jgi:hypothetical protein
MIKTCWEVLLRSQEAASPLGNPDALIFMMDGTLDAWFGALDSAEPRRWLARHPPLCRPLADTCPCGRNPLLRYFEAGEEALLAIAGKVLEEFETGAGEGDGFLAELQLAFHYLAQQELQVFCDLCRGTCARARAGIMVGRRSGPPTSRRQARRRGTCRLRLQVP